MTAGSLQSPLNSLIKTKTWLSYDAAINGHIFLLAQSAEAIRRELMPLAILTSNYTNKARKAHTNLETLIAFLVPFLEKHSMKKIASRITEVDDSATAIKEEPTNNLLDMEYDTEEIDAVTLVKHRLEMEHDSSNVGVGASNAGQAAESSEQAANTDDDTEKSFSKRKQVASEEIGGHPTVNHPSTLKENRLPAIFVSIIEGHTYKCDKCAPEFATELEAKLIRTIHRDKTATLQEQTRTRLVGDFVNKHSDRIEMEVVQSLTKSAEEKQQARLDAYEKDLKAKSFS